MIGRKAHAGLWVGLMALAACLNGCTRFVRVQPSPQEILAQTTARMLALKGYQFLIVRTGQPVFVDYTGTIAFGRAEGQFNAPDQVSTTVRLIAPGLITEIQIISIGGVQWDTNFLTGQWEVMDPAYGFNPSQLFDARTGIQAILARDLVDPVLLGMQELPELPGKNLYALQAGLTGADAYMISNGLIDNEPLQVTLWVDPGTFDLERILLVDPANPGQAQGTTWQVDFWNFDKTFEIAEPVVNTP